MTILRIRDLILLVFLICAATFQVSAQSITKIRGQVIDAKTKEPLPLVDIYFFEGTYTGTSTDLDVNYALDTKFASAKLL